MFAQRFLSPEVSLELMSYALSKLMLRFLSFFPALGPFRKLCHVRGWGMLFMFSVLLLIVY
jgi:hypothetical protein